MLTTIKVCVAMVCISVVETAAILRGIDGAYLTLAVMAIAGLGGYVIGRKEK